MKLMVLTCGVFPSEAEARRKLWIFLKSCEKYGVEQPHLYGCGTPQFPGYIRMKLDMQLDYLKQNRGDYTHVLYTDGWDAFFTGPLSELLEKYQNLGAPPMLSSAFTGLANVSNMDDYAGCFDASLHAPYPHVGGYIAEMAVIIDAFERMLKLPRYTGDDCFSWYDGWQEGWFRPELDSRCEIFQVSHQDCSYVVAPGRIRLWNTVTRTEPCILHLSGGYTDPATGKDDRMIPWAEKLGVLP